MAAATPAGATISSSLTPVDLSGLGERWDAFVGQLQAYDSNLEVQRQGLQGQLVKKIEDFKGAVAGFASRCAHLLQGHQCCVQQCFGAIKRVLLV